MFIEKLIIFLKAYLLFMHLFLNNMHCAADFHREIVSEMGELGVLGPTIKGKYSQTHKSDFEMLGCYFKLVHVPS